MDSQRLKLTEKATGKFCFNVYQKVCQKISPQ